MQTTAKVSLDQKDEKSSTPSLFDQIYAIAKNAKNDKDASKKLASILTKDTCIDVLGKRGQQTPASQLAKEGNREAVEVLMELGANVNWIAKGAAEGGDSNYAEYLRLKHGANVNWIARGAAQGGDRDYAEQLRLEYGANVNWVAWGAAVGGQFNYAEYLRLNHGANVNWIARGAAEGGHCDYAEDLRIKYGADVSMIAAGAARGGSRGYAEDLRLKHSADVHEIARGAALGGDFPYAEDLRLKHGANVNIIANGAARGGHRGYAEGLRQHHGANLNEIAIGTAVSGHQGYAEYFRLNHGVDVNVIAENAAIGCQRDYAERLRLNHGANVNRIANGAARGGDLGYAEYLYLNHGADMKVIASNTNGLSILGFTNKVVALHQLSFLANKRFREQFAKELKDQKLIPAYDVTELVPKAERIVELRPKYNYRQCMALGSIEIQTWFLHCSVLIGKGRKQLPEPLFLTVATYLSRCRLTYKEASHLYKHFRFDTNKKLLMKGVDQYYKSTQVFFVGEKRIKEFSEKCAAAENRSQLLQLLTEENKRINPDAKSQQAKPANPFNELITKHLKRLS